MIQKDVAAASAIFFWHKMEVLMQAAIRDYASLFKLRVCSLITFSAVIGLVSVSSVNTSAFNLFFLILFTMMASMGASAFNHYFDMDIDSVMQRTKKRPIPSGKVENSKGILAVSLLLFASSILLSFRVLNPMTGLHLFLGGFVYAVVYTAWLKRTHWSNIIIGGLAGSFAVLAGGASATPELCLPPVLLAVVLFFWTPSHFWAFAIVHKEEYEKAGVPMLPNVIGEERTAFYILVNTVILVASSLLPVYFGCFGAVYAAAAAGLGGYFIIRNIQLVSRPSKEVAWKNFKASMFYLGGLFMAVIIDSMMKI